MNNVPGADRKQIAEIVERLGRHAVELLAHLNEKGAGIREQSKTGYGKALEAHMLLTGTIWSALLRHNAKPGRTSESASRRLLLVASFVQGIDTVETSVSEGFYIQAAALLKQELETIAAITEVRLGKRVDERTPNVGNVPWSLGQLYGSLNEAAHVAETNVLQAIVGMEKKGDAVPVAMAPLYRRETANNLFALHVALLALLAAELDLLHKDLYEVGLNDEEQTALVISIEFLIADGFLRGPSQSGPEGPAAQPAR